MVVGESAGTVFVTITGDASTMGPLFSQVATQAQAAGAKVAQSFNAGAATAADLDRVIGKLITTIQEESASASLAAQRNAALAQSFRKVATDAHGAVSEIQATSGALRVLEGSGGIRAAERFLTLIPGLGKLLVAAFPIIGAIALFDALGRLADKVINLKGAEEDLKKANEEIDTSFRHLQDTLDHITVEHISREFGTAAAKFAEAGLASQKIKQIQTTVEDLQDSISLMARSSAQSIQNFIPIWSHFFDEATTDRMKTAVAQINALNNEAKTLKAQAGSDREQGAQDRARESGGLAAKQLEDGLSSFKKTQEQKIEAARAFVRAQQDSQQLIIDGDLNQFRRAKETADLQATSARDLANRLEAIATETANHEIAQLARIGAARSAGQSKPQQSLISEETRAKQGEAQSTSAGVFLSEGDKAAEAATKARVVDVTQLREVQTALNEEIRKGFDTLDKGWKEAEARASEYTTKVLAAESRVAEIQQAAAGEQKSLSQTRAKIDLENQYAAVFVHTRSQEVGYLTQIADLDHRARLDKIAGLESELKTEEAVSNELRDLVRIAALQAEIAKLKGEDRNATAKGTQPATKAANAPGQALASTINGIPGKLASGIAQGITSGHIGQTIKDSLKGIGKEMLGEVLTSFITAMLGNTIATIANTAGVELNTLILELGSLLGFADGTSFAPGGLAMVGERGPELVNLPRGSQVIPNHILASASSVGLGQQSYSSSVSSYSSSRSISIGQAHFHGVQNMQQLQEAVFRGIPRVAKARTSKGSPYS